MSHIAFYHLQQSVLEEVLPKLLEKTLNTGKRALVRAGSIERVEALSSILWTKYNDSWLPHGTKIDGTEEDHPIWLTTEDDNPNGASFMFLVDAVEAKDHSAFERYFYVFDGNNEVSVDLARGRWKSLQLEGHELHYWKQNEHGKWEEQVL